MSKDEIRIRNILYGMRTRCNNKNHHKYKNYGARGIKVCDEWMESSDKFIEWSVNNGYYDGATIDRIDNDKDYCPNNCRWVDNYTQANNKSDTIFITYNNITKTMSEWAKERKCPYSTLYTRHQRGWSDKEIIEGKKGKRKSLSTKFIKYKGEKISLVELSEITGVNIKTLYCRFNKGWTDKQIIEGKR